MGGGDPGPEPAGRLARQLVAAIERYRRRPASMPRGACRFTPSCSAYAQQAISQRGAVVGSVLAARRILRCNRWRPGGYDPVPVPGPRKGRGPAGP